jgi:ligand-binding SRPBCC domain-containing protein
MAIVRVTTDIAAPQELCFDLARSIDLHAESLARSGERAVAGVTQGLIGLGQEVTWSARHFGVRQRLTSRITAFDRPHRFRDSMVRGVFARIDHDHLFEPRPGGTRMIDDFDYAAPLGPLGRVAERLFLSRYLRALLVERALAIKTAAEGSDHRRFVLPEPPR